MKMSIRHTGNTPWKKSKGNENIMVRRSKHGMEYKCVKCGHRQYGINNGFRHRNGCES